jgi:uncharacterized membrane protein HdeD (DUF308 family)
LGFKRRKSNYRDTDYKKKRKYRLKFVIASGILQFFGVFVFVNGIIPIVSHPQIDDNYYLIAGLIMIFAGVILLSLSPRNKRKFNFNKRTIRNYGIIVLCIGFLIITFDGMNRDREVNGIIPLLFILIGIGMIGQRSLLNAMGKFGNAIDKDLEGCHCCQCTNCDRNHNHWTHQNRNNHRDDDEDYF